ncbi:unnamed protein product [Microthlaspi erraticum]|uniref:CASP-like protein n=1 Tax=Microthlaspi erraticum TaxID=1685480 RepID=A0A6D2JXJ2_9BRAS|nr:unnamed protein product [Microthlaspi erraticum]
MVKKIFVQITVVCLVLAMMIAMVSGQEHEEHHEGDGHDHASAPGPSSKKPSSAVFVAADMFTGLAAVAFSLVAVFSKQRPTMMKKIFVQTTVACLVLAMMIAMVSAQKHDDHDDHEGHEDHPPTAAKSPNSAVIVAADMFTGLAAAAVALVAGFIY